MRAHLDEMGQCFRELSLRGKQFEEQDKVLILLSPLDKCFEALLAVMETLEPDKLSWEYIRS